MTVYQIVLSLHWSRNISFNQKKPFNPRENVRFSNNFSNIPFLPEFVTLFFLCLYANGAFRSGMVFELWISRLSICFSPNGGMLFRPLPHAVAVLQSGLMLLSFISRSGSPMELFPSFWLPKWAWYKFSECTISSFWAVLELLGELGSEKTSVKVFNEELHGKLSAILVVTTLTTMHWALQYANFIYT